MRRRGLALVIVSTALAAWGRSDSIVVQTNSSPSQHRIVTRWAASVRPERVLPEYPRPQMIRPQWKNLNGLWKYEITSRESARPSSFSGQILVPFPVESQLSGVTRPVGPDQYLWYRREFDATPPAGGRRLLLHFGAVDWEAVVSVNSKQVGIHRGGYDPFTIDVTEALLPRNPQELVVRVWDPTNKGPQPRGKQVLNPRGIWYTAVTGIWQTVWLEPVPATYIESLRMDPDIDAGLVRLQVNAADAGARRAKVRVRVLDAGRAVADGTGAPGETIAVLLPNAKLWSPASPFLYSLKISLAGGDSVESYFGMRKISVGRDAAGIHRLLLNNQPLFQFGQLDQGWWPDGLYTAPTDEALRSDIETQKKLGFNTIRKHVKVEPARWYYHCDRLGMLVWQDMPSGDNNSAEGKENFMQELGRVLAALRNQPSIVMWVPFNEGWGQHDTERYVEYIRQQDSTRLINNASGWEDRKVGDVADHHAYPGPTVLPIESVRASVIGEFGGLGLPLEGHTWLDKGNWGYRSYANPDELGAAYRSLLYQLRIQVAQGASAAIYTQTTDVEVEVNGLMTYDRAVVKMPAAQMANWNAVLYGPPLRLRTIVPGADTEPSLWRYSESAPPDSWTQPEFDDSSWVQGRSGFGSIQNDWARVNTPWKSSDLWLRRTFELPDTNLANPNLRVFHDDDAEVYLNGQQIANLPGSVETYFYVRLGEAGARALRPGRNTLAMHVHQDRGPQYIDAGLVDIAETPAPADQPVPRTDENSAIAHAQLLEKAAKGRIDVYFEGDSITRRWGAVDYPEPLANWNQNFLGWNAADFGWGADTTQNVLWRLENGELDGVNPKIIVLLAGTNNVGNTAPADDEGKAKDVTGGLQAILRVLKTKAPGATIIVTGIFPRNDNMAVMPVINKINENLSRFADGKRIRYLNINGRLADRDGRLFEGMMNPGDKLHPTVKAYQIWADALKPLLRELLGPPAKEDHAPPPTGDPAALKRSRP